jgi:hypothetical protein
LSGLLGSVLLPLVSGTVGLLPGAGVVRELFFR